MMATLAELLHRLLQEGRVSLRERPAPSVEQRQQAPAVLRQAYDIYRLDVAGPPVMFDEETALAAGELVLQASWFLVSRAQPEAELEKSLVMPRSPRTPSQHLSADLTLRFLSQIYQRARTLDAADLLPALLATVLRHWPLSGVLSTLEEAPLTSLDFDHPGLLLLYAERLARTGKIAWIPEGQGFEYVELVWKELGKDVSALAQARRLAQVSVGADAEGKAGA